MPCRVHCRLDACKAVLIPGRASRCSVLSWLRAHPSTSPGEITAQCSVKDQSDRKLIPAAPAHSGEIWHSIHEYSASIPRCKRLRYRRTYVRTCTYSLRNQAGKQRWPRKKFVFGHHEVTFPPYYVNNERWSMISAQLCLPTTADTLWWVLIETAVFEGGVVGGKTFLGFFFGKISNSCPPFILRASPQLYLMMSRWKWW